jgi:hypothetical protein
VFLGGLLGDGHALADIGPRGAGAAGLIDEVPDQVVGHFVEMLGGQHRVGELVERIGVTGRCTSAAAARVER